MSQVYTAGTKFKLSCDAPIGSLFSVPSEGGGHYTAELGEEFAYFMRINDCHLLSPVLRGDRKPNLYVTLRDEVLAKYFVQMKNEKAVHTIATLNVGDVIKNTESLYLDSSCGTARSFFIGGHEFEVMGFFHDCTRNKVIVQDKTGKFFVNESDLSKFECVEMYEYKPWAIPTQARPFGVKPEYVTSQLHPLVKQSFARAEADRFIALNQELFIAHWIKHNPDENFDDYILVHQARKDGSVGFSMERKSKKGLKFKGVNFKILDRSRCEISGMPPLDVEDAVYDWLAKHGHPRKAKQDPAKQGVEEFKANLKRWTEQVNNGWISSSDFQRHICNYKFPGVDDV